LSYNKGGFNFELTLSTPEALDKFLVDVERQIDAADKLTKQNAEETLRAVAKFYQQRIAERVTSELAAVDECLKVDDEAGARHHRVLADIYQVAIQYTSTGNITANNGQRPPRFPIPISGNEISYPTGLCL